MAPLAIGGVSKPARPVNQMEEHTIRQIEVTVEGYVSSNLDVVELAAGSGLIYFFCGERFSQNQLGVALWFGRDVERGATINIAEKGGVISAEIRGNGDLFMLVPSELTDTQILAEIDTTSFPRAM